MALTKERKILIAVAGVACGLFLLDRALMGGSMSGPAAAHAAGPSAAALTAAAPSPAVDTPFSVTEDVAALTSPQAPTTSLAQRLAHAGRLLPDDTPDAFRPSSRWDRPTPGQAIAAAVPPPFNAREFADRHPLDAVFASPQGAYAMVAGQAVRPGESRGGMTLTSIGDRWVIWSGHGVRVKVHLDPVR